LKFCLLASLMAIVFAEPPPQNGYSYQPPSNQLGYPTPAPERPNNGYLPPLQTSQRPRPPSSSYRPPPTQRPRPSPTYGPPPTQRPRPPPTPAPSYGPPSLSDSDISPIGLRPQRPQPSRRPQPPSTTYGPPADDHHHEPGMPYDFQYAVRDADFGNDFSQQEKSDGDVITGEYRVLLPDGRTQIVRYTADWKNGYNAEVTYEGEARYPESQSQIDSQGQRPGYNYNAPARSFNPSG